MTHGSQEVFAVLRYSLFRKYLRRRILEILFGDPRGIETELLS